MAIDPVCLMEVDEATAQWTSEYKGETYYFCAPGCKASFDENPEKYLNGGEQHADHDHGMHAGHDHSSHADHDHEMHAGHDNSSHAGHDPEMHSGHDRDDHEHTAEDH